MFTPSHDPTYLDEAWASLEAQTFTDWEWVVLLNRGAQWAPPADPRVRVRRADHVRGVGAAKAAACEWCSGDVLVELDHDDVLATSCLQEVWDEFTVADNLALVYSDCAQITADGSKDTTTWDQRNGWEYGPQLVDGRPVLGVQALEPTPHNVSYIWFAPNHVRAFPRWAYDEAGGYDADLTELDDQDLMCRLYEVGPFRRIPRVLYFQRVHPANTQADPEVNARIQRRTVELHDAYVERMALAWTKRAKLLALDLGGAHGCPDPSQWLTVDLEEGAALRGDVFDVLAGLADNSVGAVRAVDFLEHVEDTVRLMNEVWRVLAPDGLLLSCTPSTDGRGAFQDPTHVSFFNENSWWYFTDAAYANYVSAITCRFQASRCVTYFPTEWHRQHDISYVQATLIALKPGGARNGGILAW